MGRAGERVTAGFVEVAGVGEGEGGARECVVDAGAAGAAVAGVVAPVAFRLREHVAVIGETRKQAVTQTYLGVGIAAEVAQENHVAVARGAGDGFDLAPVAGCGRRLRGTSGRGSPRSRGAVRAGAGAASWWWRLRCGRAAVAGRRRLMEQRAAISTWFWRGAFTETARLSKPMSLELSLKRA